MLILSRKKDEGIMIGDGIKVFIKEVKSDGTVKVGIEAPAEVKIYRDELYQAIIEANKESAHADTQLLERLKKISVSD